MNSALKIIGLFILNTVWASHLHAEAEVNFYNWGDYIDTSVLEEFEEEYGIKINYDTYDSAEIVDTKLLTGGTGYDVVIHASSNSKQLLDIGVYKKVDYSRLENAKHLDPTIFKILQKRFGEDFGGVPYMWGTTGIAYNSEMIKERMPDAPVHSSALLFDPDVVSKFADCGVTLLDDSSAVLSMALLYLGYPADSIERQHLLAAEELLAAVRPYIKYFNNSKMLLDLPSEEVCVAMTWSGDFAVANMRAQEAGLDITIKYSVPEEGATDWMDNLYIPADANNVDNAYLLIDFLTRPEIAARNTNMTGYANAVGSATPLVDPEISSDPAIYPDAEIWQRLHESKVLPPKEQRLRTRSWIKVKTGI
jgi:putrescine transport system substrate-binding protein